MNSFSIWHILILFVIATIFYVTYLFARSYKLLIEAIGSDYISINSNLVFLIYLPFIGLIFYLILAFKLKNSLQHMFLDGKISVKADVVFISLLAFLACTILTAMPLAPQFMALAALICAGFNWSHVINARKLVLKCRVG